MAEEEKDRKDMDTARFVTLITMFSASAYQSMGKLANPLTGKTERNLEAAKGFIDVLIMLRKKTEGNLTEDEKKLLNSTISDLQMNYVKEKEKPEPEKKEEAPAQDKEEEKVEEKKETAPEEEKTSGRIITPPSYDAEKKETEETKKEE